MGEIIQVDIVGGSISGLSAAIALRSYSKNIDVIVHEKYARIGYNHEGRRCGEAHSVEREWSRWMPPESCVYNWIAKAEVDIGSKHYSVTRKPGTSCILNRQAFIAYLGNQAEQVGVQIQTHDKIFSNTELSCEYIVDASGCPSTIKRELGIDHGFKGVTYQQSITDCNVFVSDLVQIQYSEKFGYFWVFPRDPLKKEVNLGIGFIGDFGYNIKQMLEEYKSQRNITGSVEYVVGGLIPLGLQRPFKHRNILFVGDAGVGAFPFSGQGIYRALLSGDTAGKLIASGNAHQYPHMINKMFIKWDMLGKMFIYANYVFRRIDDSLVLYSLNNFISIDDMIHF
ncbi:MAG: NAD(P)/FAD-dependent oxidoreductase [Candidatus Thermoplasmatota archaeon]|nr:NAD(P)/FAD-dependent oxidoreductase [Candidatus Thermoplasmatota archaeon]MBU1940737.1 NAD(P)/FAD-dependent oxidoreductase [Candidatus Thermoplasmatota archaeon]